MDDLGLQIVFPNSTLRIQHSESDRLEALLNFFGDEACDRFSLPSLSEDSLSVAEDSEFIEKPEKLIWL